MAYLQLIVFAPMQRLDTLAFVKWYRCSKRRLTHTYGSQREDGRGAQEHVEEDPHCRSRTPDMSTKYFAKHVAKAHNFHDMVFVKKKERKNLEYCKVNWSKPQCNNS
jgi:hypothetical protein